MVDANQFGLSFEIMSDFQKIFARYPDIQSVLLFGSRANGTYKDGSDIDLAVMAPNMSSENFSMLWGDIEDLPLVFKVDLLHWDRLTNAALQNKIIVEGKKIY